MGYKPWCPCDKGLNVSDDYVDIWCVPSATHVPCINESQNKVLGIGATVTLLSETSLYTFMIKMSMHKL